MLKKILLVNILILIVALGICEYVAFNKVKSGLDPVLDDVSCLKHQITKKWKYENKKNTFQTYFPQDIKGPILLFGCSYVEGGGIPDEEIFANVLSRDSNRIVYKRGRSNSATDFMYKQLMDENIKLEVPTAEYIIYVYLRYHGQRNFRFMAPPNPENDLRYTLKNGKLIENDPFFTLPFYSSFIVQQLQTAIEQKEMKRDKELGEPLFLKFIEESNFFIKNLYPNSKFIVLEYPDGVYSYSPERLEHIDLKERGLSPEIIEKIRKMGIIYVNAEELVGHELRDLELYRHTDKEHPNGRAWKEVSDALIKRFNL